MLGIPSGIAIVVTPLTASRLGINVREHLAPPRSVDVDRRRASPGTSNQGECAGCLQAFRNSSGAARPRAPSQAYSTSNESYCDIVGTKKYGCVAEGTRLEFKNQGAG
ncbi:MAG TPA: hypothetical protein VEB65_13165 [Solirubrobacterales bacterium]|nr:hypothetical protein [Solirubrobacterales bacterium]